MSSADDADAEISAISTVYGILKALDAGAQRRVLDYVRGKLGHAVEPTTTTPRATHSESRPPADSESDVPVSTSTREDVGEVEDDGINEVARKWVRRNNLDTKSLGAIFSLGADEMEVVAKKMPGDSKKARMRSVALLTGIAAYLGTGTARYTHAALKEACLHYDAYDQANVSNYMKAISSEVSGTGKTGYHLTARGLAAAADLIKQFLNATR